LSRFILQTIEEFSKFSRLAAQATTNQAHFTRQNSELLCMKAGNFFLPQAAPFRSSILRLYSDGRFRSIRKLSNITLEGKKNELYKNEL
jgi:hypothetical protein